MGYINSVPSGTVFDYAGSTAPNGWLLCFGQVVAQSTYPDLFRAIGSSFNSGGEGAGNFRLPDCRGRSSAGKDDMGGTPASRITSGGSGINGAVLGANGGGETHTLNSTEMPSHTHTQDAHTHTQNAHTHTQNAHHHTIFAGGGGGVLSYGTQANSPAGIGGSGNGFYDNYLGQQLIGDQTPTNQNTTATNQNATATNQATGGGLPHSVMHPTIIFNKIIKI